MDAIFAEMERHTPATGYNIVCIDEYEMPGERLTTCCHADTAEEALELLRQLQAGSAGEYAIYPAKGEPWPSAK